MSKPIARLGSGDGPNALDSVAPGVVMPKPSTPTGLCGPASEGAPIEGAAFGSALKLAAAVPRPIGSAAVQTPPAGPALAETPLAGPPVLAFGSEALLAFAVALETASAKPPAGSLLGPPTPPVPVPPTPPEPVPLEPLAPFVPPAFEPLSPPVPPTPPAPAPPSPDPPTPPEPPAPAPPPPPTPPAPPTPLIGDLPSCASQKRGARPLLPSPLWGGVGGGGGPEWIAPLTTICAEPRRSIRNHPHPYPPHKGEGLGDVSSFVTDAPGSPKRAASRSPDGAPRRFRPARGR